MKLLYDCIVEYANRMTEKRKSQIAFIEDNYDTNSMSQKRDEVNRLRGEIIAIQKSLANIHDGIDKLISVDNS